MSRFSMVVSLMVVLAACGSSSGEQPSGGDAIAHYLAAVRSGDGSVVGQARSGALPSGSGPSVQAATSGAVLPGGSSIVSVSSGSAIDHVVVGVQGASGYYELTGLPSAASQSVLLTLAQSAPSTFSFLIAGGSGGSVGASATVPVTLTAVGTGDVQVSLTWDVDSDVDLHVVDPSGEEVFYGNPSAASGGQLDLDSNAGCELDHKRAENITWPTGHAPSGHYQVLVDYWDACSQTGTHYVVTVNRKGAAPATFSGAFSGPGDQGEQCVSQSQTVCGVAITSFDVP
jgi:hypothetical protein